MNEADDPVARSLGRPSHPSRTVHPVDVVNVEHKFSELLFQVSSRSRTARVRDRWMIPKVRVREAVAQEAGHEARS